MHYDLIIKNGTIVTKEASFQSDIAVKDGKIIKNEKLDKADTACEVYDAEGKHILPGIIDAHVHFRDPGLTEKEDFETGSIAAVMGGITMIADMPNVIPVTSTVERFNEKLRIAKEKSYADFAFFALLNNENTHELEGLRAAGALGFKVFLGTSTGEIAAPDMPVLIQQMETCASSGIRIGFHCETSDINSFNTSICKNVIAAGNEKGILLSEARPVFSEALAIQTAVCYAHYTKAKIHIHHITSLDGAILAAEARNKGIAVSTETCPHYLVFDAEKHVHKVYPPIRTESHKNGLWEAIKKGVIDMIASDHAPHLAAEKALPVWEVPAGLCGVETMVPVMLNEINNGKISINEYVSLSSEAPAKIWGVYPQKGNLNCGADADITIVDMNLKRKIKSDALHSKSRTSPYDEMDIQGFPVATIIRGVFVMKDGVLTGQKGHAKLISPAL